MTSPRAKFQLLYSGLAWTIQGRDVTKVGKWKMLYIPGAEPHMVRVRLGVEKAEENAA